MKIWISFVCLVCTILSLNASEPFDYSSYNNNLTDFKLCTIRVILPSGAGDGDVYNLNYNLDDLEGKNHPLTFNFVRHSTPECPNQWNFSISIDNGTNTVYRSDTDEPYQGKGSVPIHFDTCGIIKDFDGKQTPPNAYIRFNPNNYLTNITLDLGQPLSKMACNIGGTEFNPGIFEFRNFTCKP